MKTIPRILIAVVFAAAATVVALAAAPLMEVAVAFGAPDFRRGDSIVIEQVLSTSPKLEIGDTVVIRGRYTLASQDRAKLGISLARTESRGPVRISPAANKHVTRGSSDFELRYEVQHVGCLNVSLSALDGGRAFGRIYLGTPEQLARIPGAR